MVKKYLVKDVPKILTTESGTCLYYFSGKIYLFSQKAFGKTNKFNANLMVKNSIIKRTLHDLK